jgi:hypothetical protein
MTADRFGDENNIFTEGITPDIPCDDLSVW